ncbi:MAG: ABC transporter [Chloroflexi bacterium]|nr:ABC transporter [Chloroflexota bacterium]
MRFTAVVRSLGPVDLKSVSRDSMLLLISVGSLALALAMRYGVPFVTPHVQRLFALDLGGYTPLLMSFVLLMAPGMVGSLVGFLVLDERDDGTLTALLVTPISLSAYLLYRIGLPVVIAFLVTLAAVPIAGLTTIPFGQLLLAAALSALSGGIVALAVTALAANKVEGFGVLKMLQGVQVLPVVAWFVPTPWQWLIGIVPTYWPAAAYWRMAAGELFWGYLVVGLGVNLAILALLLRHFRRSLGQD